MYLSTEKVSLKIDFFAFLVFFAPYIVRRETKKVSKHPRRNQRVALAEYRIRRLRYRSGPDPTRLLPVMERFVLGMDRMALLHGAF